eukprot:IDg22151t1
MSDDADFVSFSDLAVLGSTIACRDRFFTAVGGIRRFRGLFGVSPRVCCLLMQHLAGHLPHRPDLAHLLWALLFSKVNGTEHVHATLAGFDEKRFRKWSRIYVRLLRSIKLVRLSDRRKDKQLKAAGCLWMK